MLTRLFIQNIAVIHKVEIELGTGLNIFTGETGAGKTILISAIDAVLGERMSRDIIRTGEEKAVVSALFEDVSSAALETLRELGYEDDEGTLLITRELTQNGKSNCKINGMPATAAILRQVTSQLIHIHGQRDGGQLLTPESHIHLIDAFGDLKSSSDEYRESYEQMRDIQRERDELDMDEQQKNQRIDLLTYQIGEIDAAGFSDPGEEEELVARKKLIGASERVLEALSAAYEALSGGEEQEGINALFDQLGGGISLAADYLAALEPMSSRLEEMRYELVDYAAELHSQLDSFDFDPRELNDIEYRLDAIYKLKRKYGGDIAAILEYCENARQELEAITSSEERLAKLDKLYNETRAKAEKLAQVLTKKREKAAKEFIAQVEEELTFLDMPSVKLSIKREQKALAPDGWDEIAFYVSTNVGEEPKPLSKIASGGEISRMMLSMKNVLAHKDAIDSLIFDEVDIGVSGRAAQKIGQKLSQVSRGRQVLCVTHLAQVAAFGDRHFLIYKEVGDGRTYTKVDTMEREKRVEELARITSGDAITKTALENAAELLALAEKNKG